MYLYLLFCNDLYHRSNPDTSDAKVRLLLVLSCVRAVSLQAVNVLCLSFFLLLNHPFYGLSSKDDEMGNPMLRVGKIKMQINESPILISHYSLHWIKRHQSSFFPCHCDRSLFLISGSCPSPPLSNCLGWHLSWPLFTLSFLTKAVGVRVSHKQREKTIIECNEG